MRRAAAPRKRSLTIALAGAAALVALTVAPRSLPVRDSDASAPAAVGALAGSFPHLHRIALLVLENREYGAVIGNRHAPFLSGLARRYALATHYYAIGHPSLPNYLAMTGGSTFEIHHDCNACDSEAPSIVRQLDDAGISWRAYFEGLPRAGFLGRRDERYTKHFNPFVYYTGVRHGADRARILPLADLDAAHLPRFTWIAPDLCHDSHNCSVRSSDSYTARLVREVLGGLGPDGVLFVTWDEGTTREGAFDHRGGGHIALIAAGPMARRHATTRTVGNHYSLLRTIEAAFRLPALGRAGSPSTPLLTGLLERPATAGGG
jgi:hypothetical protein